MAGLICEFVQADAYDIPENYNNSFDLIYISIGFLPWLPDLNRFFKIAARLLRNEGHLVIYDTHPFLNMFDPGNKGWPPRFADSYFRKKPWADTSTLDYYASAEYEASIHYDFPHTLTDIFGGLIEAGMVIIKFEENADDISLCYAHFGNKEPKIPMSYILIGQKK
jgi:ubiquinone/menaquinone biosynthesis C-methylase UbiE